MASRPTEEFRAEAVRVALRSLSLHDTQVSDFRPLAGLSALYLLQRPDGTQLGGYPRTDEGHAEVQAWLDDNAR